jgi:hypothetical protein
VPDIEKIYFGLSGYLGVVIAQNSKGDHIGQVRNEGLKWGEVSNGELVRGYRTNAYMPFHSDPTDRVGLLCVRKAMEGGLSSIASSMSIYNEILATHPEALDCLFNGFYYSLRGETGGGLASVTEYRIPVFDHFEGRLSTRYVRKTIEQGATVGNAPLSLEERAALDLVDTLAKRDDLRFDMAFERNNDSIGSREYARLVAKLAHDEREAGAIGGLKVTHCSHGSQRALGGSCSEVKAEAAAGRRRT